MSNTTLQFLYHTAMMEPLPGPVKATVHLPGSKSYTNRALLIASLAKGTSILHGCSNCDDSLLLIKILKKLGIKIESDEFKTVVTGNGGNFKGFKGNINAKDAGTVMRFLTALCCVIPGEVILKGTPRMNKRPIKGLVDALSQLGAHITYIRKNGFPPVKIEGGYMSGGKVKIDSSQSSQFISALLMIAPLLDSDLEIITDDNPPSLPYIDMSIQVMERFGVKVQQKGNGHYLVKSKQAYQAREFYVEADASCATYLFGMAAITQSAIRVNNLSPLSLQGDVRFADLLLKMGCKVKMDLAPQPPKGGEDGIEVTGANELKAIEADMKNMPDAAPALAVVAAFAKGTTILKGLKNLELKESKRLTVLQEELSKMGIKCESDGEQLTIHGGQPKGAFIKTYKDHRIAMAFAMAGARIHDMSIQSPEAVFKSFPGFWNTFRELGIKVDFAITGREIIPNIALIGFMGSGKSAVGKILAKALQKPFYETDEAVLKLSGSKSINEIFAKKGESYFRELEKKAVFRLKSKSGSIISCGGGVVMDAENMKFLQENCTIIYLSASFETISRRLKDDKSRPLFKDKEMAKELYKKRVPLYEQYAGTTIYTDNLNPDDIISAIISISEVNEKSASTHAS